MLIIDYHIIEIFNFHWKNVAIIISLFQNAENGQRNLCPGQGKSRGTFFRFLVGIPYKRLDATVLLETSSDHLQRKIDIK